MSPKPLIWVGSSKKDLDKFPEDVKDEMGHALYVAQVGDKHTTAKPLKGLGSGVLEIVDDYRTDTFRAVYTVQFDEAVYVLHCFQKKSKSGIKTPKQEIDMVKGRLKQAMEIHKELTKGTLQ